MLLYYFVLSKLCFYPSFVFLTLLNLKLYKNYLILFFVISPPGIVITVSGVPRLKIKEHPFHYRGLASL